MTAPDGKPPAEEHYNPATGYVETTPTEDEVTPADPAGPAADGGEHYNPATGYVETTPTED